MTTARHLATIDEFRARLADASGGGRPSHPGTHPGVHPGVHPGFHLAELATSEDFWEDDGTRRALAEEQYEAERDGLAGLLAARWGPPVELDLWPLLERSLAGESLPEPWSTLCSDTPELLLWQDDDRWIGLGISQWDKELPLRLLAVVTTADPPRA
ncbi:hypothetical protein [Streptomyces narbonensis]|uniref:hypothetical protein n=1 Tax=Streptomyces narbonensis TaxID=67333 RepID=UPI001675C197|nr:hypothetical protein [Streptomyces narbonensis]GGW03886.1 hypothetical protein GCM10010230_40320 [Streptomyces narbonensis]